MVFWKNIWEKGLKKLFKLKTTDLKSSVFDCLPNLKQMFSIPDSYNAATIILPKFCISVGAQVSDFLNTAKRQREHPFLCQFLKLFKGP